MSEEVLSRQEHEEFAKRIDAENKRQNARIEALEETVRQINELTISVREMAVNMGNMLEEQRKQGVRLEKLEMEPGETHKQIRMSVITTVIGAIVGAAVGAVLMIL